MQWEIIEEIKEKRKKEKGQEADYSDSESLNYFD